MGVSLDVSDIVDGMAQDTVVRKRTGAGAIPQTGSGRGLYSAGAETSTPIEVCMTPVNGRTRRMLPEGIRINASYLMWTTADVQGDQPANAFLYRGDKIVYDSKTYQVYQDRRWAGHGAYKRFVLVEDTAEP